MLQRTVPSDDDGVQWCVLNESELIKLVKKWEKAVQSVFSIFSMQGEEEQTESHHPKYDKISVENDSYYISYTLVLLVPCLACDMM